LPNIPDWLQGVVPVIVSTQAGIVERGQVSLQRIESLIHRDYSGASAPAPADARFTQVMQPTDRRLRDSQKEVAARHFHQIPRFVEGGGAGGVSGPRPTAPPAPRNVPEDENDSGGPPCGGKGGSGARFCQALFQLETDNDPSVHTLYQKEGRIAEQDFNEITKRRNEQDQIHKSKAQEWAQRIKSVQANNVV